MRNRWTRDLVLAALRRWAVEHGDAPAASDWAYVRPDWAPHPAIAVRLFGSWREAIREAGFEPRTRAWTGDQIIDEIRMWVAQHGVPPKLMDWRGDKRYPQGASVAVHFGSWNAAIEEAGFQPRCVGRPRKAAA